MYRCIVGACFPNVEEVLKQRIYKNHPSQRCSQQLGKAEDNCSLPLHWDSLCGSNALLLPLHDAEFSQGKQWNHRHSHYSLVKILYFRPMLCMLIPSLQQLLNWCFGLSCIRTLPLHKGAHASIRCFPFFCSFLCLYSACFSLIIIQIALNWLNMKESSFTEGCTEASFP